MGRIPDGRQGGLSPEKESTLTAPFQTGPVHMQGLSSADPCRNERVRIVELFDQRPWEPLKSSEIAVQPVVQAPVRTHRAAKVSLCLHAGYKPLKHTLPRWKIYLNNLSVPFRYQFCHQRMQRL